MSSSYVISSEANEVSVVEKSRQWLTAAFIALAFAIACALCLPARAFADGGLEIVRVDDWYDGSSVSLTSDLVTAEECPSEIHVLTAAGNEVFTGYYHVGTIVFSKNVSFDKGRPELLKQVQENLGRVHFLTASGEPVPGGVIYSYNDNEMRHSINVLTTEPLAPISPYKFVVDAGVVAANGEDVLLEPYEYSFVTGPEIGGGWTIWHIVCGAAAALLLVAGIVGGLIARHRQM